VERTSTGPRRRPAWAAVGVGTLLVAGAAPGPATATASTAASPPALVLPSGQMIAPVGRLTVLRAFPTGAAVSPDGTSILAIAGKPATVNTAGTATTTLTLLDAATGIARQMLQVGDAFQSVLYSVDGYHAYVAGGGDGVVHAFDVEPAGLLSPAPDIALPGCGFVSGLALTEDRRSLWAACPDGGVVIHIDLTSDLASPAIAVPAPDRLALSPDGATLYATNWRGRTVAAVSTSTGAVREIGVGDHPSGIATLPDGRVLVADANDATLATIDPATGAVTLTSLALVGRGNDSPNDIAVSPDGRVFVSLGEDNAVAVLTPAPGNSQPWKISGLVPTGWYPTAIALSPDGGSLDVVSARGLGHSAGATVPYVDPDPVAVVPDGAYFTAGTLQTVPVPDPTTLRTDTDTVLAGIAPWKPQGSSDAAILGQQSPIHHVIYITRENKLYDTELGDLHPGPGAALAVFGQTVTPNMHALARDFVDAQAFYEPAFRSTTGHMWEDAGGPSDIYERSVGDTSLNSTWSDPTLYPATGLLVTQALNAGLTVRTYNEEIAQQSGLLPPQYQADQSVFPNYDLHIPDTLREKGWESEFQQFESHQCTGSLAAVYGAACGLPSLEYVYLGEDHTTVVDEPGYPTIEAQVADNDYATARIVDAVSHSADWASTLIVITEDDPQGTGDHISAYRGLVGVASPWVKRGVQSSVHYQWTSVVHAIDRVLGLPPLTDYAAESRPLDDMFTTTADLTPFTADTSGVTLYPFIAIPGSVPGGVAASVAS